MFAQLGGSIQPNALLGLLAALLWGGGDFSGSIAVKRLQSTLRGALRVIVIGHLISLTCVAGLALAHGDRFPCGASLAWGLGGGVISGISLVAFYIALAQGHMGSAAAVSGLLCAAVPAVVSAAVEGTPSLQRLVGFTLAASAIVLIAAVEDAPGDDRNASRKAMTFSILGGLGFGIYFVALKVAGTAGLLWPMGTARIGSAGACLLALLLLKLINRGRSRADMASIESQHLDRRTLAWIVGGAALDTGGNLSFIAATRAGRLDVAAVLASIYPASTILLAALLLKEKTTPRQRLGMLIALPAVVLITL